METLNTQQPRTINNAVPLKSAELLTMDVKGIRYYVRPITGFTGYFASTCGAVISCVSGFNGKRHRMDRNQPKLLRQFDNGRGYLCVFLYAPNGHRKHQYVHRLVATNLLQKPEFVKGLRYQVNNKNQQRGDNRACNLEWVLPHENLAWNSLMEDVRKEQLCNHEY